MRTIAAVTLTLAAALPAAAQPVTYSVRDLGVGLIPQAINASGQTAGFGLVGNGTMAFRGSANGQVTYLGAVGGSGVFINASGQVAARKDGTDQAVLTTATGDLSTATVLSAGLCYVYGVSDTGQVAGYLVFPGSSVDHAARTTPGGVFDATSDLGAFNGGQSFGYAINAAGQVTGDSDGEGFRTTATGTLATADDLGGMTGMAINASGQVAGYAITAGNTRYVVRSSPNGQPVSLQDLGTLEERSTPTGINALGVVVGYSDDASDTNQVGFVYDTSMHNLNNLVPAGWNITEAYAINDSGQIAATGSFQGGTVDGLVLTPIPVPEPSALALTGLAGVWLASRKLMGDSTSSGPLTATTE
jgi:probable HAF family extracellular repeat protein